MASLWPWLVLAGVGALHGLNPATGWLLAAAWGAHAHDRKQALRALVPIAAGHAASVALVAGAVVWGLAMDRMVARALAGASLMVLALGHLSGRTPRLARASAGHAGLALWSFMMSSAHGAGLMLVPALIPLCAGDATTMASGPLALAPAPVGEPTPALLAVPGAVAVLACRGMDAGARLPGVFRRMRLVQKWYDERHATKEAQRQGSGQRCHPRTHRGRGRAGDPS